MIFLAEFVYQKICYGAFLSLISFTEIYKTMAKKTCNYLTTLLLFWSVIQSEILFMHVKPFRVVKLKELSILMHKLFRPKAITLPTAS